MSSTRSAGARSRTSRVSAASPPHAGRARAAGSPRGGSRTAILSGIVSTYARLAELPLTIEGHELERLERPVSSEFTRVTTIVRLRGAGEEGLGEDVTYSGEDHERFAEPGAALPLAGEWTIDSFSNHLDGLELFPEPPGMEAFREYRRWAFESAALDLALRQAGTSLAAARRPRGAPGSLRRLDAARRAVVARAGSRTCSSCYPGRCSSSIRSPDWTPELVAELADLGRRRLDRPQGRLQGHRRRQPAEPRALPAGRRGLSRRRGSRIRP